MSAVKEKETLFFYFFLIISARGIPNSVLKLLLQVLIIFVVAHETIVMKNGEEKFPSFLK